MIRTRGYTLLALFLAAWAAGLLYLALKVIPDGYWYSYYAVDYRLGFIRRGMAGELAALAPGDYFGQLRVIRWLPTVSFLLAMGLTAWSVLANGRSERRVMLAFLIPVLPFGLAFGLFSARPDLFGAAALACFAVALTRVSTDRAVLVCSAVYGVAIAVLATTHEAIPLLFGLGAIAALVVLAPGRVWAGAALAVLPGLAMTAAIAVLGRRGVSGQLCSQVPHAPMNHPLAGKPTLGQLLRGFRYDVDYHDWLCRNILPLFDQTLSDGARFVASLGWPALLGSTVFGAGLVVLTLLAIGHITNVPLTRFRAALLRQPVLIAVGLALMVPIFLTAVDWVRWWVLIGFDVGIVFLLFAAGQPDAAGPVTHRTRVVFAVGVILLALLPIGVIPGFGAPVPV